MHEFNAWINNRMTMSGARLEDVFKDFTFWFTGSLREWFKILGLYRQLQLIRVCSANKLLGTIYQEFIGNHTLIMMQARNDYFQHKCRSLQEKDLNAHYQKLSPLFYMLNAISEPNFKRVYMTSLPDELQNKLHRAIAAAKKDLSNITIGQIHKMTLAACDKVCEKEKFFTDLLTKKSSLEKACQRSHLQIKCRDKSCYYDLKTFACHRWRSCD